jgi:hypothetical protein
MWRPELTAGGRLEEALAIAVALGSRGARPRLRFSRPVSTRTTAGDLARRLVRLGEQLAAARSSTDADLRAALGGVTLGGATLRVREIPSASVDLAPATPARQDLDAACGQGRSLPRTGPHAAHVFAYEIGESARWRVGTAVGARVTPRRRHLGGPKTFPGQAAPARPAPSAPSSPNGCTPAGHCRPRGGELPGLDESCWGLRLRPDLRAGRPVAPPAPRRRRRRLVRAARA